MRARPSRCEKELVPSTKSFLMSFSPGLEEELRAHRVSVVTLCPGRILANGNAQGGRNGDRRFGFVYQSAGDVVREALKSLTKGGGLVIPGFVNKASVFAQRFVPRRTVPKLVAKMSRQ